MDIIITLPAKIEWSDYQKEIEKVTNSDEFMFFKVASFPKNTVVGERCYIVHRGYIKGWMKIAYIGNHDFVCSTTGKTWEGKFIARNGKFNPIAPIKMKGFQNWRYYNNDN